MSLHYFLDERNVCMANFIHEMLQHALVVSTSIIYMRHVYMAATKGLRCGCANSARSNKHQFRMNHTVHSCSVH